MTKRLFATALLALFALCTTGCIGSMALSGKVRQFNMNVSEGPWAREGVFLLLYFIPVYPFAGTIDLLLVNSVEFWTGTNPVSGEAAAVTVADAGDTHREVAADGSIAVSTQRDDGSIDVGVTTPDGTLSRFRIEPRGDRLLARDAEGRDLGSIHRDQL